LPLKSNLWFVCWLFCNETEGMNRVFSTVAGEKFKVEQKKIFTSLEFQPIKVFKVTPAVNPKYPPTRGKIP